MPIRPASHLSSRYYTTSRSFTGWLSLLTGLVGLCLHVETQQPASIPVRQFNIAFTDTAGQDKNAYSTDKQVIEKGQALFQANCSACHNFGQKGIGPNLSGVTASVTPSWLRAFIHNAPEQIAKGDSRATRLFAEYNQYMPAFTSLNDAELTALMAYIHTKQKSTTSDVVDTRLGPPLTDPIPTKIAQSGLRLALREVLTAPATASAIPLARINKMQVLPGKPNRLFIEDLRGPLYEWINDSLRVVLDIAKERSNFSHKPGLATGFGSYAFHPNFYQNGLLYTTHTEPPGTAPADFAYADSMKVTLQWVVTEWKINDPTAPVFGGKGRELFRINMVSAIHGMQEIAFNPLARSGSADYGLLYIGVGDGGATENGYGFLCHDKTHLWGAVLRIDPQGTNSRNGHYGIPPTNPYAHDKQPNVGKEIFCRGFRNPNRFSWSPDGKLLITDIGQARLEEINLGKAGADYGWPEREGTFVMNYRGNMGNVYALSKTERAGQYTYPVAQYDHDEGNAISGGFVYTGTKIPLLTGKYIFGDVVNGRVFYVDNKDLSLGHQAIIHELSLELAGQPTSLRALCGGGRKTDFRIGIGLNQNLFLYTKTDGKIYEVTSCSGHQ